MALIRLGRTLLTILLTLTLLLPGSLVLANPPPLVDVLVTFYQPPGPAESQLIETLGGTVKRVYTLVPTILAAMPEANIITLRSDPRVKSVDSDAIVSLPPDSIPAAPSGMMSPMSGGSQVLPWGIDRIDAELVYGTNNGTGIKIAVLDTGIDLSHPDLRVSGNVTFVSGTTNGNDDNGHGTIIAGIIGALDNDIGVVGVAPEASLYSVKVLNSNGNGNISDIISGIEWAVNNGMQIIDMNFDAGGVSWGGYGPLSQPIQNAYNAGLVLIAGAGNWGDWGYYNGTGTSVTMPANEKGVIAVGATDNTDTRYSASSMGYELEVMAPGVNIYSTAMGGGYGYMTGTSAASPHAAGLAALLIKSGLTNNLDVRRRLRDSAQDLGATGWDPYYGKGIINANSAINFSEPPDKSAPLTTISINGTVGNNGWWRSDVLVTLNVVDYSGSGVAQSQYSLNFGQTWNVYTGPFYVTTQDWNTVIARSWDNAGNDEGPADYIKYQMDKTPPLVTLVIAPQQVQRGSRGSMYTISYNGSVNMDDGHSGWGGYTLGMTDEYGVYYMPPDNNVLNGSKSVEQWCQGNDTDGRAYTFRLTATDWAGNQSWIEAVSRVVK